MGLLFFCISIFSISASTIFMKFWGFRLKYLDNLQKTTMLGALIPLSIFEINILSTSEKSASSCCEIFSAALRFLSTVPNAIDNWFRSFFIRIFLIPPLPFHFSQKERCSIIFLLTADRYLSALRVPK